EVQVGLAIGIAEAFVQRLPGVLFHVDARNPDALETVGRHEFERPGRRQRSLVLRDLITLWKIGIEVVLAREDRCLVDMAAEREAGPDREIDSRSIEDRQRAGKPEAHRTDVRVRWRTERRTAPAENLGSSSEMGVNLEADDGLKHTEPRCIG